MKKTTSAYEIAVMIKTLGLNSVHGRFIGNSVTGDLRQSIFEVPSSYQFEDIDSICLRIHHALLDFVNSLSGAAKQAQLNITTNFTKQFGYIDIISNKNSYRIFVDIQQINRITIVGIAIDKL